MQKVKFKKGKQKEFFDKVRKISGLSLDALASKYGKSGRTFRDWSREKFHPDFNVIDDLSNQFSIPVGSVTILDRYWYVHKGAQKGAYARLRKYGPLGTSEGRSKGGAVSQAHRKENPQKFRDLGCIVRKEFKQLQKSDQLAELCGILLGDGGITNYQINITLDRKADREYAEFVKELFFQVTNEYPKDYRRDNVININVSGVALIEAFEEIGLIRGDKIRNQVQIPVWILRNKRYSRACVRGLFDTDGSLYRHRKLKKTYMGWTYTSYSLPLLKNVANILLQQGIVAKSPKFGSLYLYNRDDIRTYMDNFGSSNPKHVHKFTAYMEGCAEW